MSAETRRKPARAIKITEKKKCDPLLPFPWRLTLCLHTSFLQGIFFLCCPSQGPCLPSLSVTAFVVETHTRWEEMIPWNPVSKVPCNLWNGKEITVEGKGMFVIKGFQERRKSRKDIKTLNCLKEMPFKVIPYSWKNTPQRIRRQTDRRRIFPLFQSTYHECRNKKQCRVVSIFS